jgi:hypothetical protein
MKWWDWLGTLSQGQATFLGSLVGALVGLFALLLGALFNAWLNRRRDDRLRTEEQRSVATALRAELAGCRDVLLRNSEQLKEAHDTRPFLMVDLAHSIQIWPHMIPKLGLFDQAIIGRVTNAYLAVEQYGEMLLLKGGQLTHPESIAMLAGEAKEAVNQLRHVSQLKPGSAATARSAAGETRSTNRRLIFLSADKAPQVREINSMMSEAIEQAITQLDVSLRTKWWWQR